MMNRRSLVGSIGAFSILPMFGYSAAFAKGVSGNDKKFILIILRGAMDGLSAVPPLMDVDYAGLRGPLAISVTGEGAAIPFMRGFGLHPALMNIAKDKLVVAHAIASPYRQRSHFDGQAMLELGTSRLGGTDGWLNRALMAAGTSAPPALAVGSTIPLVLSGSKTVMNWQPKNNTANISEIYLNMQRLYVDDHALSTAFAEGLRGKGITDASLNGQRVGGSFDDMCQALANILKANDGPSIAVTELNGWDTHFGQGNANGRLANALKSLDSGVTTLKTTLGEDVWKNTVICAATEFGRTARPNGTNGTDHGTAGAAFMMGGALKDTKLLSDWPGLSTGALYENRDLAPTSDIRSMFKAVLSEHLRLTNKTLDAAFPDGQNVRAFSGLFV